MVTQDLLEDLYVTRSKAHFSEFYMLIILAVTLYLRVLQVLLAILEMLDPQDQL